MREEGGNGGAATDATLPGGPVPGAAGSEGYGEGGGMGPGELRELQLAAAAAANAVEHAAQTSAQPAGPPPPPPPPSTATSPPAAPISLAAAGAAAGIMSSSPAAGADSVLEQQLRLGLPRGAGNGGLESDVEMTDVQTHAAGAHGAGGMEGVEHQEQQETLPSEERAAAAAAPALPSTQPTQTTGQTGGQGPGTSTGLQARSMLPAQQQHSTFTFLAGLPAAGTSQAPRPAAAPSKVCGS